MLAERFCIRHLCKVTLPVFTMQYKENETLKNISLFFKFSNLILICRNIYNFDKFLSNLKILFCGKLHLLFWQNIHPNCLLYVWFIFRAMNCF